MLFLIQFHSMPQHNNASMNYGIHLNAYMHKQQLGHLHFSLGLTVNYIVHTNALKIYKIYTLLCTYSFKIVGMPILKGCS